MIKVSRLYYDYPGLRALNDVSFDLPPQSITALVGPNGAGKTTLLRSMAGLDEPTAGNILIDGIDVWENPREAHLRMGYLPDHFGLYQELTALQCLTHAAWTHGLRGDEAQDAVQWAIAQVDLEPQLLKLSSALSRGQRQRLALAQAIVHKPKVLFMDEPASGLDPQARASLSSLMKRLAAQGMTLLISSHILAELETYCTAMLVLEQGNMLAHRSVGTYKGSTEVFPQSDPNAMSAFEIKATQQKGSHHQVIRIGLLAPDVHKLPDLCKWLGNKGVHAQVLDNRYVMVDAEFSSQEQQVTLLRDLLASDWAVTEYAPQTASLQEVYMQTVANRKTAGGQV